MFGGGKSSNKVRPFRYIDLVSKSQFCHEVINLPTILKMFSLRKEVEYFMIGIMSCIIMNTDGLCLGTFAHHVQLLHV